MAHDRLCSLAPCWAKVIEQGGRPPTNPDACPTCDLIEQVRADERSRWNTPYFSEDYHRGYRQAQADARRADTPTS